MKLNIKSLSPQKIILGVILISAITGGFFATKMVADINKNIATAKESVRPANIKIIKITTPSCVDCFDIDSAIAILKQQNIAMGEEKSIAFDSDEAKSLIEQLDIKKVPTYLIIGEIAKSNITEFFKANGDIKNDTFVFTKISPLFIDTQTKKKVGQVFATILADSSCQYCTNPKIVIEEFKEAGIKITNQKELQWYSWEGQQLIEKYNIIKVPTFLLSADADAYDILKANWSQIGTVEKDKTYVMRNVPPPYRDLSKNQILGLVDLVYITDATCSDCYKPEVLQKEILTKAFRIGINSERKIDINSEEGKALKQKYNLSVIPTVLLSPGVDQYTNLKNIWKSVGTVEKDGWYIFREMKQLGGAIYKDLTTDKIIRPATQPAEGAE